MDLDLQSAIRALLPEFRSLPSSLRVVVDQVVDNGDPARFLSGASPTVADTLRFAVPRRLEVDGLVLSANDFAEYIVRPNTVMYLAAAAGEGKSTFLHTLTSLLTKRAIVARWRPASNADWQGLQDLRDSLYINDRVSGSGEIPIVVLAELATRLSREQEDALIETIQAFPAGANLPGTSLLIAGRPAWLTRVRHLASTGQRTKILPLSEEESDSLVGRIAEAQQACIDERGHAWTANQFPNLSRFLSLSVSSQRSLIMQSGSIVAALLQVSYGREFVKRLTGEYMEMAAPDRLAYLLVCWATTANGGVTDELLMKICADVDIDRVHRGVWVLREAVHQARHEAIGRVIVEDREAASASELTEVTRHLISAGESQTEAQEILRNSLRPLLEAPSLVPVKDSKTEPQIRAAIRRGLLNDRNAWEALEQRTGRASSQLLAWARWLHGLLPEEAAKTEENEYILQRVEGLLREVERSSAPGSLLAEQAHYHRVFVNRARQRILGAPSDLVRDLAALRSMFGRAWTQADFYARIVWLCLHALNDENYDDADEDLLVETLLLGWQRYRTVGEPGGSIQAAYASFVAREMYKWPAPRRFAHWSVAWEYSLGLSLPDGSLACILAEELSRMEVAASREGRRILRAERMRVLKRSIGGNAEVLVRLAEVSSDDPKTAETIRRTAAQLSLHRASGPNQALAMHAWALVTNDPVDRIDRLQRAVTAYSESTSSQDDWNVRGGYWRKAVGELRRLSVDGLAQWEQPLLDAAKRFAFERSTR